MTRLRMPIKPRGPHAIRWARWQEKCRREVQRRANFKCEACGSNLRPLEWCHLAGRGNVISEPWCSTPELTVGLCSTAYGELGCHQKIDRHLDDALLCELRQTGLVRLMSRFPELHFLNYGDPLSGIRHAVVLLEAAGWVFDAERVEIVHA